MVYRIFIIIIIIYLWPQKYFKKEWSSYANFIYMGPCIVNRI